MIISRLNVEGLIMGRNYDTSDTLGRYPAISCVIRTMLGYNTAIDIVPYSYVIYEMLYASLVG